jgi:hypothetical protein
LTGPPDSTGGCQIALVDKLGVSLRYYHHTMVHIAHHPMMNNRPVEAAVLRRLSYPIITNLPVEWYYLRNIFHENLPSGTNLLVGDTQTHKYTYRQTDR